ncbi:hypothetical protein Bca4012_030138 [Brassica carinata]
MTYASEPLSSSTNPHACSSTQTRRRGKETHQHTPQLRRRPPKLDKSTRDPFPSRMTRSSEPSHILRRPTVSPPHRLRTPTRSEREN